MTKTDIGIYRGPKEKFNPKVHVGFFITTDTGELLLGDQSLGQTISGWEINDGVLTLKLNTGEDITVTFPEASETSKGLLSAADKAQLVALAENLNSKVDKVTGKSLIADSEIEKLAGLPNSTELTNSIAIAKASGDNAQSDLNAHKQNVSNPHEVTKAQVGLGNVTNDAQVKRTEMGAAGGVATLDENGTVPASQLPSFVDDIVDVYATYSKSATGVLSNIALYSDAAKTKAVTGEAGKIYQNVATGEPNYQFRWTGTVFAQTGASSLIIGEVSGTAYDGAKGKANADNIEKIKGTALSHINDDEPITTADDKVTLNYECYTGDRYGTTGTTHTADIPAASTDAAGVMSKADKAKLDGVEDGAQVNTVTSVAGKTGAVTLVKGDVGLDKVDNTPDASKPVSTAQAEAIADAKKAGTDAQAAINALDAAITTTDGTNVQVKVTQANGKITGVNITTDNTAKNSDLTAEVTRAKAAEEATQTALDNHKADKDKKHIPAGGHERQILAWKAEGEAQWDNISNMFTGLEELLSYGVEWKDNVGDPHLTRIGNMSLHKTLPIQSQLKGCIAQKDKVIYWLDENDWRFRQDAATIEVTHSEDDENVLEVASTTGLGVNQYLRSGEVMARITAVDHEASTITVEWILPEEGEDEEPFDTMTITSLEVGSRLDGYHGTVRVYCPNFYIKSQIIGNTRRVWLSTVKVDNTWTYQPEILLDAYRSTVLNTAGATLAANGTIEAESYLATLPVNSAISVVNTATYCRGGGNRTANDKYLTGADDTEIDIFRTDLGKPRTYISRANMRTYSRNAGNEMLSYDQYKNIFYWLYVVEYANFNCQEAYNATLTEEGYHQGGMGVSITNMGNWNEYNGYYPLTPCGYGNKLGNGTGLVPITIPQFTYGADNTVRAAQTMQMARWRGFDNPFGDIWTNLDGIIIDADANNHPNNMNYVYTCQDPDKYADNLNGDGYEKVGEEVHQAGYTKLFDLGDAAHIIPNVMGGNTTQYKCDYHWTGDKNKTLRTLVVGGGAISGPSAGLGCFYSDDSVSGSGTAVGFRSVSRFVSFSSIE